MIIQRINLSETIAWKNFKFFRLDSKPNRVEVSLTGKRGAFGSNEVRVYIEQLVRVYGDPPDKTEFFVLQIDNQWGTMYQAAFKIPDGIKNNSPIWRYLSKLEKGDKYWDDVSLKKLKQMKHPLYEYLKRKK